MNRRIYVNGGCGKIMIPSSKSDAHRILIAAALATTPTTIIIRGISKDIEATIHCLRGLGSRIRSIDEEMWEILPIWDNRQETAHLDCAECGATFRFLLPVAGALLTSFEMSGEGRLPERPIKELVTQMQANGCSFSAESLPFQVTGGLKSGTYTLPGNVSSQYITGLMYALPLLEGDSEIRLESSLESKGYVDMTIKTLSDFGISIEEREFGYAVKGNQCFVSPKVIEVEGDWSNAAFFLALGAIQGPVTCLGLPKNTKQGDSAIVEMLERFGASVDTTEGLTVDKKELQGIEIDASTIPDLVPILAVIASVSQGETRIYNAERLRIKESNRLETVQVGLSRLGVQIQETKDGLLIQGNHTDVTKEVPLDENSKKDEVQEVRISGYGDHRIVMAMSVAAIALNKEVVIEGSEAVEKSYPTFFEHWEQIGGRTDVI